MNECPDKCPGCGSEFENQTAFAWWYDCGSCILKLRGKLQRIPQCYEAEIAALRATLPASDSPTAPDPKPYEDAAASTGALPSPTGEGAGLVKWADIAVNDWYECQEKQWRGPTQKVVPWGDRSDRLDRNFTFRRCEPPQWWKDHQAEKALAVIRALYPPDAETIKKHLASLLPAEKADDKEWHFTGQPGVGAFRTPYSDKVEVSAAGIIAKADTTPLSLMPDYPEELLQARCLHTMKTHPEGGDYCVKCGAREGAI